MLQNAYFLAKIGADTAENEQHFAEILPIGRRVADRNGPGARDEGRAGGALAYQALIAELRCQAELGTRHTGSATRRPIGKISAKCCSFSAVPAPIFARKYAFCSIFQNLPDSQAEIFEI